MFMTSRRNQDMLRPRAACGTSPKTTQRGCTWREKRGLPAKRDPDRRKVLTEATPRVGRQLLASAERVVIEPG